MMNWRCNSAGNGQYSNIQPAPYLINSMNLGDALLLTTK